MSIQILDKKLREVCPIDGVSIGRKNDKSTWRIDFKNEATDEQKIAAQKVVDDYDFVAEQQKYDEAQQAKELLQATRDDILQHLEEQSMGVATTMTDIQFTTLLEQRQEARTKLTEE